MPRAISPPPACPISSVRYRVPFYDTDAMRVVHHANYVRYLELARVRYLAEHLVPYTAFLERGLHFAVTHCELDFLRPAQFDDELEIRCWLVQAGGASVVLAYRVESASALLVTGSTGHALVDDSGRPARIPAAWREMLRKRAAAGDQARATEAV